MIQNLEISLVEISYARYTDEINLLSTIMITIYNYHSLEKASSG